MNNYNSLTEFKELMEFRLQRSSVYSTSIFADYRLYNNQSAIDYNNVAAQSNPSIMPMSNNHSLPSSYSESLQPCPLTLAAVKFREIPFYDPLHILLKPCSPFPDPFSSSDKQESSFSFRLSRKEVRDVVCNHECQILLRFCKLETETEQDDYFPPDLSIKVNGEEALATSRNKPVNITQFTKISSTVNNMVTVSWSLSYSDLYAVTLYIAKPISSSSLLQKLRDYAVRESHLTTSMIIDKIKEGRDLEIATTSMQASLLCPLGKLKMTYPCRASTCTHIACFDASLYIELNKKKWKWLCPICDKQAFYKDLEIDELFLNIISNVPHECTDVQFFENGLWTPIMPVLASKEIQIFENSIEVIDISLDSDTDEDIVVD